ncbi:ABC transporter permease [Streptomyces sp. NPDC052301]|uniref:ABC transporter permease n=1 Tax=Streptomyces sp. NPDC052301 TaxID=3365687 RepID=UPI0037D6AB05
MNTAALRELSLANIRELSRNKKTFFLSFVTPFFVAGIYLAVGSLSSAGADNATERNAVIPVALFMALGSVAFFGTGVPLVTMRERGTLRLLGTTPVPRWTVLLSLVPARLAMAAVQIAVVLAFGVATHRVDGNSVPMLVVSCLAGFVLLGALGLLAGGLLPSSEVAGQILSLALVVLLFLSGLTMPLDAVPAGARTVLESLPTSRFGDLAKSLATGAKALHPVWSDLAVIGGSAAVLLGVALWAFRWDQGEAR